MVLSGDAEQQQGATAPSQLHNHESEQLIQLFCFSLSMQYSINEMRYSILNYKIDFVLGDFAQL